MNARQWIMKVIRIRRRMMFEGVSIKSKVEVDCAIANLKKWLDFWPKATDDQVRRFLRKHEEDVMTIMPGQKCPAFKKLNDELNELIYEKSHY